MENKQRRFFLVAVLDVFPGKKLSLRARDGDKIWDRVCHLKVAQCMHDHNQLRGSGVAKRLRRIVTEIQQVTSWTKKSLE
jgi:hypothetical protein